MKRTIIVSLATLFFSAACADMSAAEPRVLSGGVQGAGNDALLGPAAGSATIDAAVGGGTGLLAGSAHDQHQKPQEAASKSRKASESKKPGPRKPAKRGPTKKVPEKATPPPPEATSAALHVM